MYRSLVCRSFCRRVGTVQNLIVLSSFSFISLEVEFSSLDSCVKSHEAQLKEYVKLLAMLDELENQPKKRSGNDETDSVQSRFAQQQAIRNEPEYAPTPLCWLTIMPCSSSV